MTYLHTPRLHFAGKFQSDPSTVNNNDVNFDPTVQLSNEPPNPNDITNTSVYWNPTGTHNFKFQDCTVRGAANSQGPFTAPSSDPIIGAQVLSNGKYPAKIVDLDPDNQGISQIWGLVVEIRIPNPADPSSALASVSGTLPPTAFADLWNRGTNAPKPGMGSMSAVFQSVLQNVSWTNAAASPLLAALQALSPNQLSIRFVVDSFQSSSNQENFTFGRVVGSIGPAFPNEPPRSTPRRLAPSSFLSPQPSIMSTFGAAGALYDATRRVLVVDLGNCVPTNATPPPSSQPSVPLDGWPIDPIALNLTIPGPSVNPHVGGVALKGGVDSMVGAGAPTLLGSINYTLSTYLTYGGVVELPVTSQNAEILARQPMKLSTAANPGTAVAAEDPLGRYVDVDVPFLRLNPGDTGTVTLWATRFGAAWKETSLDVSVAPPVEAMNGPAEAPFLWLNGSPASALTLSSSTVVTGSNGTATVTLTASDPGTPRTYQDGQLGPDGQVYMVSGRWASWGQIFLFSGAPINVLVFSGYTAPAQPTWTANVGPILSNYARMYPYMKTIIDLSDYSTVVANASAIKGVLNLPPENPHHMPVVRDLSRDKLAMINRWFSTGMQE